MDDNQTYIVNRLKQYLIDHYNPDLIILYGSTARGDADEFSDIDMMVIMDTEDYDNVAAEMLKSTDHIVQDKHIMLRSVDDYYDQRDIPGTMVYSALSEGMVLYQNLNFDADAAGVKSYKDRKRDIIQNEYLNQACEFLEQGETALKRKQIYRCRDFLKFAAIRAIKAALVFRDVHPPRSIDLMDLFDKAQELLQEIEKISPMIEELNEYFYSGVELGDISKCKDIADKTHFVVESIAFLLGLDLLSIG